ncbi:unnamed protein product [Angiostrongylus costaricensis]|uniref:Transposase n=1 Tax=Angiostrongylus costaricensis TaxID=334426 RepID=A0A0R3PSY9_ANGCS|nr:unnamed protein product [Angiostrongylus costaricensis]
MSDLGEMELRSFIAATLHKNPRDRAFILEIEQIFTDFISNSGCVSEMKNPVSRNSGVNNLFSILRAESVLAVKYNHSDPEIFAKLRTADVYGAERTRYYPFKGFWGPVYHHTMRVLRFAFLSAVLLT